MKKTMKRMIALMIMAAVIMTSAVPTLAGVSYDKSRTYYLSPSRNILGDVNVWEMTGSQSLKKANVKSSNPSVAKLLEVSNSTYKSAYYSDSSTHTYKSGTIVCNLNKPGTSTISFKIGNKTYKSKIKVLKYVNPVSSLTITGVNGGKTIHKVFNKKNETDYKISKAVSNAKVKVKARSGWYISSVRVRRGTKYYSSGENFYHNTALSTLTVRAAKIAKNDSIEINMRNKSNDGAIELSLVLR